MVPQDGGHGDCPGQVLDFVAGGGKDDPLLSGDSSFLSLPPQSSFRQPCGGDRVVVPLDGGHGDRSGPVLDLVAGGGNDDPPPSSVVLISPTPAISQLS